MKVQITGISGFVGGNLRAYLKQNKVEVKPLYLRDENWSQQLENDADILIHLAGKAHDTSHTSVAEEYFKINRDLTMAVFEKFLQSNIRDFFFFSSVKAVADALSEALTEDKPSNPQTPYGKSKFEAEQYLLSQNLPEGKRLFIIRPCMIHGPGNKGNLNLLYKIVKLGIPWPLASFHNQRSFLSADNLSFLVLEMINNQNVASGVYNFSDDQSISTNELICLIAHSNGKKAKLWNIPSKWMLKMANIGDKLHLPLNSERLKKLTESYVVSNQKIKTALEIKSLPLTAEEGLIKTINSFINN